eukprot:TRINITY_DN71414_c0_g1_i1.p1 TRINITY_DN71414_c0_g1~~TRINITY_DN71414_c0_g1_i1.p1  ORF type:complete len:139 (-),score=18.85 TRINITY_DN71414_c0_g1_i1:42-458(-)
MWFLLRAARAATKSKSLSQVIALLILINVATIGLFWYDKQQAIHDGWRISEATLIGSAVAGGWPGGYFAMERFRHKTQKQSFRDRFHVASACNAFALCGTLGISGGQNRRRRRNHSRSGGGRGSGRKNNFHGGRAHHS